ncbi:hypothetical protein NW762_012903 [Fusarium torreyae]|uniref:Uncharacterized protein n=1 Tax=Fusarium torreyae TaxID=1237075 RepID=A0A9W8RLQ6_9HYPO|nr:hypothetical protein NW762_012903 [Fusarium torreyae]
MASSARLAQLRAAACRELWPSPSAPEAAVLEAVDLSPSVITVRLDDVCKEKPLILDERREKTRKDIHCNEQLSSEMIYGLVGSLGTWAFTNAALIDPTWPQNIRDSDKKQRIFIPIVDSYCWRLAVLHVDARRNDYYDSTNSALYETARETLSQIARQMQPRPLRVSTHAPVHIANRWS